MTVLRDEDYRQAYIHRPAEHVSETCICGAAFSYQPSGFLDSAFNVWQRWQEAHSGVCGLMERQIAPRLARERERAAKDEERKGKQREANERAKAKRAGR